MTQQETDAGRLVTLARGLTILEALTDAPPEGLSHAALVSHLGLHRSTLYRYLGALQELGFVEPVEGEARYRLGHRAVQLSSASARQKAFRQLAKRYVNQAAGATGEAVHATVFVNGHAVTVAVADSTSTVSPPVVFLGTKRPAYSSASGRVFLAFQPQHLTEIQLRQPMVSRTPYTITNRPQLMSALAEIRSRGFAVDQKEYLENVYCVAVPVLDYSEEVIGTLSVSVSETAADTPRLDAIIGLLQKCAQSLSRNLGYEGLHPARTA